MRVLGVVFVALVTLCSSASAQDAAVKLNPGEVLLEVNAEGQSKSRPDVMGITAGVVTSAKTAAEALSANNAKAARMLKAVHEAGVAPADVRTSELTVDPVMPEDRSDNPKAAVILGYVARNKVELQMRDLTRAPAIIDALFSAGANSVRGPTFSLSNPKPAQRQARFAAVAAAREEAQTYAEAFGMKVARVIRSSERGDFRYDGSQEIVVTGSRIPRTPIEPGDLTTIIEIWVDYALVPK